MASMNYFLIILMWSLFSNRIIYHLLTGYEGNSTFFLSPKYQLFSEATPRAIVGTEGIIKVLLPEYQVYQCFIILNNCAIQNSKLQVLFWWISSLLYQCFIKLIHLYVCVFEEEINKKKHFLYSSFIFVRILTFILYQMVIGSFHYKRHFI